VQYIVKKGAIFASPVLYGLAKECKIPNRDGTQLFISTIVGDLRVLKRLLKTTPRGLALLLTQRRRATPKSGMPSYAFIFYRVRTLEHY
jgi:hypothetical protein